MLKNVIGNCMFRAKRCGQDKRDLVLPNHVAGALSHPGFGSAVGHRLKTERALIKMRRLLGVTDVKFDVICALQAAKNLPALPELFLVFGAAIVVGIMTS